MTALRVALVSTHATPAVGGIATCVDHVAARARAAGLDVTIVTLTAGPAAAGVVRWPAYGPEHLRLPAPGLTRFLERQVDVVHAFNIHTALTLIALGVDLPTVSTPAWHGESESGLRNLLWSAVRPVAARRLGLARIHASSWAESALLERDFRVRADVVIQGATQRVRGDVVPGRVLTVSRLVPEKRVERLIETVAASPETTLVVVGDGPERGNLESLAERMASGRIIFTGRVGDHDLNEHWSRAAVYASASAFESYGISVAEARCSGIPTLCSDIAPHRELGAFCVADGLPSWTAGLEEALAAAPVPSTDVASWEQYGDAMVDLYRSTPARTTSATAVHR